MSRQGEELRTHWVQGNLAELDQHHSILWHTAFPRVAGTNGARMVPFCLPGRYAEPRWVDAGGQGAICTTTDPETGKHFAVKMLSCSQRPGLVLRELNASKRLSEHKNIVCGLNSWCGVYNQHTLLYLCMPLWDGSLYDWLGRWREYAVAQSQRPVLAVPDSTVSATTYQLVRAVLHLHSGGLMHRDISTRNILYKVVPAGAGILADFACEAEPPPSAAGCPPVRFRAGLADFGLARDSLDDGELTAYVQQRLYRAPELLLGARSYTDSIDIWSVGVCVAEMCNQMRKFVPLFTPLKDRPCHPLQMVEAFIGVPELTSEIVSMCTVPMLQYLQNEQGKVKGSNFEKVFPGATPACREFLRGVLVFHPSRRPSAQQVLPMAHVQAGAEVCGESGRLEDVPLMDEAFVDGVGEGLRTPRHESHDQRDARRARLVEVIATGANGTVVVDSPPEYAPSRLDRA
eukprot:TRINITY_DN35528_c0_g1_i1.p1 TRINITY_DN35528_c0_g1~~TRINITY_DN35528_c0_g1_i1.p1  ORF type:complete len:459 (+),score=64.86 TRINITY_DN35528_c0_g1_i1:57-1433(+)